MTLRFSEAIRLGSLLHPQGFGSAYITDLRGTVVATCAFGAAIDAGYVLAAEDATRTRMVTCPVCLNYAGSVIGIVSHLNDWHRRTREEIADFVETVEQAELPVAACAAVLVTEGRR